MTTRFVLAAGLAVGLALGAPSARAVESGSIADPDLAVALAHLRGDDAARARATLPRIADAAQRDLVLWHLIRSRDASFAEIADFLSRNPDWPGQRTLRSRAESSMPATMAADRVIAFFDDAAPVTSRGTLLLAVALKSRGRVDEAEALLIERWLGGPMPLASEAGFLELFGDLLAPYHAARLDGLVWSGEAEAARRLLPRLPADAPETVLARARLALRTNRPGVDALIEAVPEDWRDHQGLAYERFRWRLAKGRRDGADGALAMLFAYDDSADTLGAPEAWAPHRERLARDLMQDGAIDAAYRVASRHHLPDGDRRAAQLEWLAGFVALRYRDDPEAAVVHFRRFDAAVASPISKGRAGYWLGRALEASGDAAGAAAAYTAGGRYQTSFYGQLAAERAALPADPLLAGTEQFPALARTSLARSGVFRVLRALHDLDEHALAERFATHMAEDLPRDEIGTLIDQVLAWDEPHIALMVAKRAARRGLELHRGYYPVTALAKLEAPVAPELSLSIARRESEFDPVVMSHAGARGLMQLMPGTAREMAALLDESFALGRLTRDPVYNARLGTAFLGELEAEFGPSPILVPAAYNAGPSRARRWTARLGDPSDPSIDLVYWIEDVPFAETRNYIMRVAESLLPYRAQLTGQADRVALSTWLRDGYGDFRAPEVKATRGG